MEFFGGKEMQIAREKLCEAESLLSAYYCIPGREWPLYPYDVRTLEDVGEAPVSEDVLALVTKYEVSRRNRVRRLRMDYYEIGLQDHNILSASARRADGIFFEPLMLYILTHELVHVFRFANAPQRFFAEEVERIQEERHVHRITSDILRMKDDPQLTPVLEAYEDYPFRTLFSSERL